ncbi:MAG: type II toxin-antitoxin system VapC family toxin [Candidatus Hodarchaeales archaeon]
MDSSAFIAYANKKDQHHADADKVFEELKKQDSPYSVLVTSYYVIDETITSLRKHVSHASASEWGEKIFSSKIIDLVIEEQKLLMNAWEFFRKYQDKVLSYTDCVIGTIVNERKIDEIFAFDEDFKKLGFNVIP